MVPMMPLENTFQVVLMRVMVLVMMAAMMRAMVLVMMAASWQTCFVGICLWAITIICLHHSNNPMQRASVH